MQGKTIASIALSVVSICAQFIGLWYASSSAASVAQGAPMPEDVATIAGAASTMAILFSVVALALAVVAWSKELRWGRVFTLCLAMGAVLWSLVVV